MSNASKYIALTIILFPALVAGGAAYSQRPTEAPQTIIVQPPQGEVEMGPVIYTEDMGGSFTAPLRGVTGVTIHATAPRHATPGLVRAAAHRIDLEQGGRPGHRSVLAWGI